MILAGDIGGTKTLLGFFDPDSGVHSPQSLHSYPSRDYPSLESILTRFMGEVDPPLTEGSLESAAFGVAGPVISGRCQTTNLPWIIETSSLAKTLGLSPKSVALANDLVSIAWGITIAPPESLETINAGVGNPQGTRVVVAPGTGLGEAIIGMHNGTPLPIPTEGGHVDWAPTSPEEIPLLLWLWDKFGHASPERLISGPGLAHLYHFHAQSPPPGGTLLPPDLSEEKVPETVSLEAERGNPLALAVMQHFWRLIAAEAGNMALKSLATGGVILAGGIPEKILPFLDRTVFMDTFTAKGRYRQLLTTIPVTLSSDPDVGIKGAAEIARRLVRSDHSSERSPS